MLRFNCQGTCIKHFCNNLNTSYVKVQQREAFIKDVIKNNLNTSYVKVQLDYINKVLKNPIYLNTSYVKVQRIMWTW